MIVSKEDYEKIKDCDVTIKDVIKKINDKIKELKRGDEGDC